MRQYKNVLSACRRSLDRFCDGLSFKVRQVPCEGISAQHEGQLDIFEGIQSLFAPCVCANFRRWIVARCASSRKTKPHWKNSDPRVSIERRFVDPQPVSQPISGRIIKWTVSHMRNSARCLTNDQDFCSSIQLKNWVWAKRQILTHSARLHLSFEFMKVLLHPNLTTQRADQNKENSVHRSFHIELNPCQQSALAIFCCLAPTLHAVRWLVRRQCKRLTLHPSQM